MSGESMRDISLAKPYLLIVETIGRSGTASLWILVIHIAVVQWLGET